MPRCLKVCTQATRYANFDPRYSEMTCAYRNNYDITTATWPKGIIKHHHLLSKTHFNFKDVKL